MKKVVASLSILVLSSTLLAGCNQKVAEAFGAMDLNHPSYQHHTDGNLEAALASDNDVVLFFGASRCPLCRSLDKDLRENLEVLPEDLTIVTFDYDTDTEEKKEFEVTSQHTLIYLDDERNEVKRTVKQETTLEAVLDTLAETKNPNQPEPDTAAEDTQDNNDGESESDTASADAGIAVKAEAGVVAE